MTFLLLILGLSSPHALAYLSPEEVLLQQQGQYYQSDTNAAYLAPNKRRAQANASAQALDRTNLHPATTTDFFAASSQAQTSSAGTATLQGNAAGTAGGQNSSMPPVVLRMLQRLERGTDGGEENINTVIGRQSQPLTPSGPGGPLPLLLLLGTVGCVILYARRQKGWKVK